MKEIHIKENEAGQRLDKYLHKYMKEATNSFFYKMLRKKNITLNGKKAEGSEKLNAGDVVELYLADETIDKFRGIVTLKEKDEDAKRAYERFGDLEIIYENKHVLVVNKPSGILTQKAEAIDLSLNEWLIGYLLAKKEITDEDLQTFRPSVLNRLDRNTSGIVICGKTLSGSQKMSELIKNRGIRKFYRLIVKGNLKEAVSLEGYLIKDESTNKVRIVKEAEDASYISTKYRPIKNYREMALAEVELITGKTHQIRLHLSDAGHPILGDYKYGDKNFNDRYKKKYHIKNQLLHAYRIEFPVIDGEFADMSGLILTAELPEIFNRLDKEE